jgi:hypothetical protein
VRCGGATSVATLAGAGPVTIGGQGLYVTLASSGTSFNPGTGVFSTSVTLRNLLAEPLGSVDGITPDSGGIKVFFHSGPTARGGTGTVTVANRDGLGQFTAPGQPFLKYAGALASGATSSARPWDFQLTGTVDSFDFQVLIAAQVPQASGVFRWLRDSLGTNATFSGAWGTSATNAYVIGQTVVSELFGSELVRWNGSAWDTLKSFTPDLMFGIGGFGSTLVATGSAGIVYYSPDAGAHWTRVVINASQPLLESAWASSPTDLYAAGSAGIVYRSSNGTTWTPVSTPTSSFLYRIWGTSASDIFATGTNGAVLHSTNGTIWTQGTIPAGSSTTTFFGVAGVPGGPFFAVGAGGAILRSSDDGASWSSVASGTANNLNGVSCGSATDCIAVGDLGTAVVWNGSAWSPMNSGSPRRLKAIWGASEAAVFAAGDSGTILRGVH